MREIDLVAVRQLRCFEELSEEEARVAAAHLQRASLLAGETLFRQGHREDLLYLLTSGKMIIKVHAAGQEERVLATLSEGSIFGEMGLLLNQPRSATAVAVTDSELYRVGGDDFDGSLAKGEKWAIQLLLFVAEALARRLDTVNAELGLLLDERPNRRQPELERLRSRLLAKWSF